MTLALLYSLITWFALVPVLLLRRVLFDLTVHLLHRQRSSVIRTLYLSLTRYTLLTLNVVLTLLWWHVNLLPLVAGAGIVGLVLGLGLQQVLANGFKGLFFVLEGTFEVGDQVDLNGGQVSGVVESLGLQFTQVREWSGALNTVPNASINLVRNHNRDYTRVIINVQFPFDVHHTKLEYILRELTELLTAELGPLLLQEHGTWTEAPNLFGVTQLQPPTYTLTFVTTLAQATEAQNRANAYVLRFLQDRLFHLEV